MRVLVLHKSGSGGILSRVEFYACFFYSLAFKSQDENESEKQIVCKNGVEVYFEILKAGAIIKDMK